MSIDPPPHLLEMFAAAPQYEPSSSYIVAAPETKGPLMNKDERETGPTTTSTLAQEVVPTQPFAIGMVYGSATLILDLVQRLAQTES